MKEFIPAIISLALATSALSAGAAPPPDVNRVKGAGCVQAGVESGCLVVKDAASGRLYNLLIKGAKPGVGIGIDFAGAPAVGATTCSQGSPVQVSTWSHNNSLQCSSASSGSRGKGKSIQ